MISVALADDHELVRIALRVLIEREGDLTLVGEAGDGDGALDLARSARPDVLLLDLRMPGMDGLGVLRAITSNPDLHTRVIVVTTFEIDEYVVEALQNGASGFLLKNNVPTELVHAIRVVAAGQALLSPSVTRRVVGLFGRHVAGPIPSAQAWASLTEREREMVAWVATGRSNDEIASELVLSPDTVRTHVSRAMVKVGARDRAQLVVFATRAGLTIPSMAKILVTASDHGSGAHTTGPKANALGKQRTTNTRGTRSTSSERGGAFR